MPPPPAARRAGPPPKPPIDIRGFRVTTGDRAGGFSTNLSIGTTSFSLLAGAAANEANCCGAAAAGAGSGCALKSKATRRRSERPLSAAAAAGAPSPTRSADRDGVIDIGGGDEPKSSSAVLEMPSAAPPKVAGASGARPNSAPEKSAAAPSGAPLGSALGGAGGWAGVIPKSPRRSPVGGAGWAAAPREAEADGAAAPTGAGEKIPPEKVGARAAAAAAEGVARIGEPVAERGVIDARACRTREMKRVRSPCASVGRRSSARSSRSRRENGGRRRRARGETTGRGDG